MTELVIGAVISWVILLALGVWLMPFAETIVAAWTWLVSTSLPASMRRRRLVELKGDLYQHRLEARAEGYTPTQIGWKILTRWIRGIPADIGRTIDEWEVAHASTPALQDPTPPRMVIWEIKRDREARTTVIIPALNESGTVGRVVAAAKAAKLIDEVIVVSDGSWDATVEVARAAEADLVIELSKTVGKGGAVMAGVDLARGDVLVFLDADLIGLEPAHVEQLIEPILSMEADMVVGLLGEDLLQVVAPYLAGQRALPRQALLRAPDLRHRGFALEHTLSRAARRQKWQVRAVDLKGVSHRPREKKYGLVRGYRFKLQATRDNIVSRKRQPGRFS